MKQLILFWAVTAQVVASPLPNGPEPTAAQGNRAEPVWEKSGPGIEQTENHYTFTGPSDQSRAYLRSVKADWASVSFQAAATVTVKGGPYGSRIAYFPSDVLNGEVCLPPSTGHESFRTVQGKQYYLPFEFEPVSQRRNGVPGTVTPAGRVGAWFTYGTGRRFHASESFPAQVMFDWIKSAYDRGTANVLLSLASDHTGSMRLDDVKQLVELGTMLRKAGLLNVPPPTPLPRTSVATKKTAKASGVWKDDHNQYGPAAAFDGDPDTRWAAAVDVPAGWLEVDLGAETTVDGALIHEGWDRARKFAIQYKVGGEWQNAVDGTTIGNSCRLKFSPVSARVLRLNITEASDVPTIWEFKLFAQEK